MATIQGICSPLIDHATGALPGAAWFDALDSLRPSRPLAIRGSIQADAHGVVDIDAYKRSLAAYAARGHQVWLVLEASLCRIHEGAGAGDSSLSPNAVLYPQGNASINKWIDAYSLTCCDVLGKLGPDCPAIVILGNEFNVLAPSLQLGQPIPADKPEALAPEAAAMLTWQTATRIKNLCPQVRNIYPAAMSDLVKFQTSVSDDWIGGYLTKQIQYLEALGLAAPWPWQGVLLNQEGALTAAYENYIFYGVSHLKSTLGITGPTCITEFGTPSAGLDVGVMTTAFNAANALAYALFFYLFGQDRGYGTHGTPSIVADELVPGTETAWCPLLRERYQNTS